MDGGGEEEEDDGERERRRWYVVIVVRGRRMRVLGRVVGMRGFSLWDEEEEEER